MTETKQRTADSAAPANAKNGVAPHRKFGTAHNFSSDSMNNRGGRGRRDRRGRGRRNNRDNANKMYEEQTISIDRVSRTVKGGRRLRFKALVVMGDRKNRVGVGVAKGRDVQQAIEKANSVAKKNMVAIPLVNGTIPHDIEVKYGAAHVLLKPAAPGTGIIAGGVIRTIIGTTGINNLVTKSLGSTNKVNIAYATIKALSELKPREEWVGHKSTKTDDKAAKSSEPAKKEAK